VNEADTCRKLVVPKLVDAGWEKHPHSLTEQRYLGRKLGPDGKPLRDQFKRADYVLRYAGNPIAVVEAKAEYKRPADGLEQAKVYAQLLDVKFSYATNGHGIREFDFHTGLERDIDAFPRPEDLWARKQAAENISNDVAARMTTPGAILPGKTPHYYQEVAINRALTAILQGKPRVLLTMATGTGKTFVAFQICYRLWSARWTRSGEMRRPRMLFLADRNILVDDPYVKMFAPFGDARSKIENGEIKLSREMYFAIYQALAEDERRPGLYKELPRDFFDFIVVDECHRGSANEEGSWREILEYFEPACQLGMTATPQRDESRNTYEYFGAPVYKYSLKQGIQDGFLAPYRVHRVVTPYDVEGGWTPKDGDVDRDGQPIPKRTYITKDYERVISVPARTEAIARHLTEFMKATDRFAKTIVFCVDQEHALEMRKALVNLNQDLVKQYPDYVCRVTAEEGDTGRGHLSRFQDLETKTPVILTTSQLLTTGVDAPMVKNVVLVRVVNSLGEFKQIIGRGTRLREDYGKVVFNILDYTGSATKRFEDPEFDGEPEAVDESSTDERGETTSEKPVRSAEKPAPGRPPTPPLGTDKGPIESRKIYLDDGKVIEMVEHTVYEYDGSGKLLRGMPFASYTADLIRALYASPVVLRQDWSNVEAREAVVARLAERGVNLDDLVQRAGAPGMDPLDVICHVAFAVPPRTRQERVELLRREHPDFLERHAAEARQVLEMLLDLYATHGTSQFVVPDVLKVPPLSDVGNVPEIARIFGGGERLRDAVQELQMLLYAV
jgi:type I restriction enzyme R subunit